MNPFTDFIFIVSWIALLVLAIASIVRGFRSKSVKDFNAGRISGEWTTEVSKPVHPEMRDVKPGTELLGGNFEQKTEWILTPEFYLVKPCIPPDHIRFSVQN